MNKFTKRILSLALVAMMMVTLVGSFSVSAAETEDGTKTIYFLNNKDWEEVYAYTWSNDGVAVASFPGEKLDTVGTIGYMCGGIFNVYAVEITDGVENVIFSEGFEHGQQSTTVSVNETKTGDVMVYLDDNNHSLIHYYFDSESINPAVKETAVCCEASTVSEVQEPSGAIDYTEKLYFINNKDWEDVYAYTYSEEGVAEASFPGEELELIGHIKVWNNDIRDYELKEVYLVEDLGDEDDFIIFSEGYDHGQQSNDISIKYKWGGYNVIDLDVNNKGLIGHFFNPNEIIPIAE